MLSSSSQGLIAISAVSDKFRWIPQNVKGLSRCVVHGMGVRFVSAEVPRVMFPWSHDGGLLVCLCEDIYTPGLGGMWVSVLEH